MKNNNEKKSILENLLMAIIIVIYFCLIIFMYYKLKEENIIIILKIFRMVVLVIGIMFLEIGYRKENTKRVINSLEIIFLAAHSLSVTYIVELKKLDFIQYILFSAILFAFYYIIKMILIFTKERKKYLDSLSDIKEITINDPIKKVATRKNKE